MTLEDRASRILAYATLQRTRELLASRAARAMAGFISVAYALVAMLLGQMLVLAPNNGPHYSVILWSSGNGTAPWNYPALLVSAGWGSLALPFFPTIAMVVVAVGVGLGMSVSVLLAIRLLRQPGKALAPPTALGSVAGLTPAMIALVTLGACCSTTAAATAGLGAIAQANGTSIDQLLANNWFVGVFQMTVLWVALVAQEQLIGIYGALFGLEAGTESTRATSSTPTRRSVVRGVLRVLLLIVGVVAALSLLVDWTVANPAQAGAGEWFAWLVQLEVPALFAVATALFPSDVARGFSAGGRKLGGWVVRAVLLVAGISLLAWFPPAVVGAGLHGLGNELVGAAGLPASWGAVSAPSSGLASLLFRWEANTESSASSRSRCRSIRYGHWGASSTIRRPGPLRPRPAMLRAPRVLRRPAAVRRRNSRPARRWVPPRSPPPGEMPTLDPGPSVPRRAG